MKVLVDVASYYFEGSRSTSPERALLLAVLSRALSDLSIEGDPRRSAIVWFKSKNKFFLSYQYILLLFEFSPQELQILDDIIHGRQKACIEDPNAEVEKAGEEIEGEREERRETVARRPYRRRVRLGAEVGPVQREGR